MPRVRVGGRVFSECLSLRRVLAGYSQEVWRHEGGREEERKEKSAARETCTFAPHRQIDLLL